VCELSSAQGAKVGGWRGSPKSDSSVVVYTSIIVALSQEG
jgi:hypothetical protein